MAGTARVSEVANNCVRRYRAGVAPNDVPVDALQHACGALDSLWRGNTWILFVRRYVLCFLFVRSVFFFVFLSVVGFVLSEIETITRQFLVSTTTVYTIFNTVSYLRRRFRPNGNL